jgi:transcriptional regulator with XRE-family HTH domain
MAFQASRAQKRLADAMSELRAAQGLSHRDVATMTGWSTAKISRVENALSRLDPADARLLAQLYKVPDTDIEVLCTMANDDRTGTWWTRYERWLSASFVDYLGYEDEATCIWTVQTMFVPGLLQTRSYIDHLVTGGPGQDSDRADAESEVRLLRQRRLEEPDSLRVYALLGEPVLHWQFGGPDVLHEQLCHLRDLTEKPNVSIRVIPYQSATAIYPLDFFEFGGEGDEVAFSETQWGTPLHTDPLEIRQARRELARLESAALSEIDTAKLIEQRIRKSGNGTQQVG